MSRLDSPLRLSARAFGLVVGLVCAVGSASAQDAAAESAESAAADGPGDAPELPVITLDEEFVIEGRVRKPEAFFFLRRTPFGYVIRLLDDDFLEEIVRAAASEPF